MNGDYSNRMMTALPMRDGKRVIMEPREERALVPGAVAKARREAGVGKPC